VPILHVAIPHHDEPDTLPVLFDRIAAAPLPVGWSRRVVVCDDASPPAALDVAARSIASLAERGIRAILLRHETQRGKGAAVRTAFGTILDRADDEDAVVLQDADLEYDPADHAALLARHEDGAEAVLGSRWTRRGAASLGPVQRIGNWMLTLASNAMTGQRLSDMECGLKLLSVPVLRRIVGELDEEGFGIEPQITASLARNGVRIDEVPVSYAPRTVAEGKKISWRDGLEALRVIRREQRRRAPTASAT
jgi:glycosyltransferase involved in cell wall biosynthesis